MDSVSDFRGWLSKSILAAIPAKWLKWLENSSLGLFSGAQDFAGTTWDFAGRGQDFKGARQDFEGRVQDFAGAVQHFAGATWDFEGGAQTLRERFRISREASGISWERSGLCGNDTGFCGSSHIFFYASSTSLRIVSRNFSIPWSNAAEIGSNETFLIFFLNSFRFFSATASSILLATTRRGFSSSAGS